MKKRSALFNCLVGTDLLEVELVAEHALAELAHPGPALPAGAEQGRHLVRHRATLRRLPHKHSIRELKTNFYQVFVGLGGYLNMEC